MRVNVKLIQLISLSLIAPLAWAQSPGPAPATAKAGEAAEAPAPLRPGLFMQEDWAQSPRGPATSKSISNPNLELKLYVPSGQIDVTGRGGENLPKHVFTGECSSPCAFAFRDKRNFADLSGLARIRMNTRVSGFHEIRPIVKLADGTWWIGDHATGTVTDWLVSEISYADLHWLKLDIKRVVTVGDLVDKIDLTKVDEIGFADLIPGSGHGHGGWVDVAQFEVYGHAVPRAGRN
jgi:hypothetical protein